MTYYCLPTEPYKEREQDFPTKYCWVAISKDYPKPIPPKGKKRIEADKLKEYNKMVNERNKMFAQLDTGYYNCFNRPTEVNNIAKSAQYLLNDFSDIYYRVEPISSNAISADPYHRDVKKYNLYEFNILNKCETIEQLFKQLDKDCNLVEFMREIFDTGKYGNKGYREKCINYFKYCKDNFKDFSMNLSDIVFRKHNHYERYTRYAKDERHVESLALELINLGYLKLYAFYSYYSSDVFIALINSNWFNLAKRYITENSDKEIINTIVDSVKKDKKFESLKSILKINNDNEDVKEIIKTLDYDEPVLTLRVFEYDSWDDLKDNASEIKEFNQIDEIRSYLISQYQVPFSQVLGDITDFYYNQQYRFIVE